MLRAKVDWLKARLVHALQNALHAVDDASSASLRGWGAIPSREPGIN